jgi:hypothetical protein
MTAALTDLQKASRTRRREEIVTRIHGSGDLKGDVDAETALAIEIETYEWADGNAEERARRQSRIVSTMGSGAVNMRDVVATVTGALAALDSFE